MMHSKLVWATALAAGACAGNLFAMFVVPATSGWMVLHGCLGLAFFGAASYLWDQCPDAPRLPAGDPAARLCALSAAARVYPCPACGGAGGVTCTVCRGRRRVLQRRPAFALLTAGAAAELQELRACGYEWPELEAYAPMWGLDQRAVAAERQRIEEGLRG